MRRQSWNGGQRRWCYVLDARAELRPEDAGFAEAVARLVAMPLDQYAREGTPLGIRVRWCREPLWFVPIELDAELLGRRGVCRGQVWTARELIALMVLPDQTSDIVQTLTLVKRAVDGGIVEVRRR